MNVVLHRHGVTWASSRKMAGMEDLATRFHDPNASIGEVRIPPAGRLRLKMLAHRVVPRACPVLSSAELETLSQWRRQQQSGGTRTRRKRVRLRGKAKFWAGLLESASVVHCFPPGGDPEPGEKRFVFMGHPRHTQAELNFARKQGLWRVAEDGRCT